MTRFRFAILLSVFVGVACTNERRRPMNNVGPQVVAAKVSAPCTSEFLATAQKPEGLLVESLPTGRYLYSSAVLIVEKRKDKFVSQAVLKETSTSETTTAEIVCASAATGDSFEAAMLGATLIDTTSGEKFVTRQFATYLGKDGYAAMFSNVRLTINRPETLKQFFSTNSTQTQIYRLNDGTYAIHTLREMDGLKSYLILRYDYVL